MLKDKWEDKHGTNLPAHTSLQGLSDNVTSLTSRGSNFQDGKHGFPINNQFDNQFHQQNHSSETRVGQSVVDSNLQELITVLSANYGPKKTPLEIGTPEYMKLVEILKQGSVNGIGSSVEESSGDSKEIGSCSKDGGTNKIQNVDKSTVGRKNQEKISCSEQLWEGSLQLSSSVTLSAVAFFKSGEKLVGNNWPEFIEVKGKVRLEAFEKYVQGLPRSRNRGLMVTSICWNEGSSSVGLNGMKEVAKGYKKSSRVGFAHLLSGTDLYICPRSDPIITILAKYGFFKGMSVLDDKPDSMIGCVVWRKNRPSNPVGNITDVKSSPSLTESQNSPPGFSSKQRADQKIESSQLNETLTLPLTTICPEVEPCDLVVKKRPFEDDDLPEFDFGKSTVAKNNNNGSGSLKPSLKKTKLFDDDDMPEWQPPELHNQPPPQITANNFQTLPLYPQPPLPPVPPPPRADMRSSVPYLPFRPPANSQPPVFVRPPQPLPPPPRQTPPRQIPPQPLPPPPPQPPSSTARFGSNHVLPVGSQPPVFVRPPPQPLPPPPPRPPSSAGRFGFNHVSPVNSQQPVFVRPPPQPLPPPQPPNSTGRFSSNQVVWHQPPFPPSIGRHPQL